MKIIEFFSIGLIIKTILVIMFLLCLLDMPYGYYQLVRFLGMIGFAFFTYEAYKRDDKFYSVLWMASLILINPIFKISLGREIWNVVDIIWVIVIVVSIRKEKNGP